MGNCVGRADDYVLHHERNKWIVKYGQQVVRGLLDCENSNLMTFNRKYAATETALSCHKNLYSNCFDPCFPLPSELKLIDPKIVEKLGAERKFSKGAAVVPEVPKPLIGDRVIRDAKQTGVKQVISAKEKSFPRGGETAPSTAADLNVYVVTWNMNGKVPNNFADLFDVSGESHDFFVVGLQEAPNFDAKTCISEILGDKYCLVESSVLMSLQLFIFSKRSLKPFISGVKVDKVWEKGLSGIVGKQKGAAAVRLHFGDKSFLFITSHLAAHESNLKARNAQCAHICHSLFARSSVYSCFQPGTNTDDLNYRVPGVPSNVVEESDVVIWLGDLNYRLELPRRFVQNSIKNKNLQELWAKDQLSVSLPKGQAFKGFHEGPLLFAPTFKYDVGTDNYDTGPKERVPSWTDRILYKTTNVKAELRSYDAISSVKTSDHRPVEAHLTFKNLL